MAFFTSLSRMAGCGKLANPFRSPRSSFAKATEDMAGTEMHVADAIAPVNQARYYSHYAIVIENIQIIENLHLFAAKNGFETVSIEWLYCQRFQQCTILAPRAVGQAKVVENLDQALLAQAGPVKVRVMVRAQQVVGRLADDLVVLFGRQAAQKCRAHDLRVTQGREERDEYV